MISFYCRGIAEVPENVSDAGSLGGEPPVVEPIVPTLGLGLACDMQATTLFQYRPTAEQHLAFEKGDIIKVIEQQVSRNSTGPIILRSLCRIMYVTVCLTRVTGGTEHPAPKPAVGSPSLT